MPIGVINAIFKNEDEVILKRKNKEIKRISTNFSTLKIDILTFDWFTKKRYRNFVISSKMIKTIAFRISKTLGNLNIKRYF